MAGGDLGHREHHDAAAPPGTSWRDFPQPSGFTISTPQSRLRALAALAGASAELFALTDFNNAQVGGQPSSRATFDGDPFPADNQLVDGEDTPHDRAAAIIKMALINADRLHYDAAHNVMVDEATATTRGTTVTTVDAAYAIVGLRTAVRSVSSTLTLYSNDTPDAQALPSALDTAPLASGPPGAVTLSARAVQLIAAQADFISGKLMSPTGAVANFYDLKAGQPDSSPTRLESEASAIRGLLDAFLATSNEKYKDAAVLVYGDLDRRFWMNDVRAFRTTAGHDDPLTYTPAAFGTLQGALRQYWKLVAREPGNERERRRVARARQAHEQVGGQRLGRRQRRRPRAISRRVHRRRLANGRARAHRRAVARRRQRRPRPRLRAGDFRGAVAVGAGRAGGLQAPSIGRAS